MLLGDVLPSPAVFLCENFSLTSTSSGLLCICSMLNKVVNAGNCLLGRPFDQLALFVVNVIMSITQNSYQML